MKNTKICSKCGEKKPLSDFPKQKGNHRNYCKVCDYKCSLAWKRANPKKVLAQGQRYRADNPKNRCRQIKYSRKYHFKYTYGITIEQYDDMYIEQGGCCAICGKHQLEQQRRLAVDHCHITMIVRGLLCDRCNTAIGLFKEDRNTIINALDYLDKYRNVLKAPEEHSLAEAI
jgi:hypothetical protein